MRSRYFFWRARYIILSLCDPKHYHYTAMICTTVLRACVASCVLAAVMPAQATAIPEYHNPAANGEFPILAWYSILPDSAQTPERYRELREAGFNISFPHLTSNEQIARALDAMDGSGVKLMVTSYELVGNTAATVNRFKDNPNVAGWFLRDEPTASGFKELAEFRDRVYGADTTHVVYLNLFPSMVAPAALEVSDYDEYVNRFIDEVRLPMVSYDFYPIVNENGRTYVREQFYDNLERVSRICRERDMPFWGFCLSTAHTPYPIPNNVHMRFEAFSALAYGAQGLQYFTYWQPGTQTWNFHNAPIDETGRRTNVYYLIKDLNREIHALTPVFLGAQVKALGHTGAVIPMSTQPFTEYPAEIRSVNADGPGVLVSHLVNGGRNYIMIVNRDIDHSQTVTVDKNACVQRVLSDGRTVQDHDSKAVVGPGDYLLYTWQ